MRTVANVIDLSSCKLPMPFMYTCIFHLARELFFLLLIREGRPVGVAKEHGNARLSSE